MKIRHRYAFRADTAFGRALAKLPLEIESGDTIFVLNITEDHECWPTVRTLSERYGESGMVFNDFTKAEIRQAAWLALVPTGHFGYPQPEGDFGYVEATYDTTHYCPRCGIGAVQDAPFRFRTEPKSAHSKFLQLNWVFDEWFVTQEVQQRFAEVGIHGVQYLSPVIHKNGQPLSTRVQLSVQTVLPPGLQVSGLETVTCQPHNEESHGVPMPDTHPGNPYCGRVKYHRGHRGPFRFDEEIFTGMPDIVKSHEWFGSGASAFRMVLVSKKVAGIILDMKWRGIGLEPVEFVNGEEAVTDEARKQGETALTPPFWRRWFGKR